MTPSKILRFSILMVKIEEVDLETWYERDLRSIPPPEDWSGPYELTNEDLSYLDGTMYPEDWNNPLDDIEPDQD